MDFSTLLWVLLVVWAISFLFYAWKIHLLLKAKGVSIFSLSKLSRTSKSMARKHVLNILLSTLILVAVVLIAYFANQSP